MLGTRPHFAFLGRARPPALDHPFVSVVKEMRRTPCVAACRLIEFKSRISVFCRVFYDVADFVQ